MSWSSTSWRVSSISCSEMSVWCQTSTEFLLKVSFYNTCQGSNKKGTIKFTFFLYRKPLKKCKYRQCPNWLNPPPLFWLVAEHFLRLHCNILQNATKQLNILFCWPLKMYKVFQHCSFF